jgi:hypothetical protein
MTTVAEQLAIIAAAQAKIDAAQKATEQARTAHAAANEEKGLAKASFDEKAAVEATAFMMMLESENAEEVEINAAQAVIAEATAALDALKPSFLLTAPASVNEGESVTVVLSTTNMPLGAVFAYLIAGVEAADIDVSLMGSFPPLNESGTSQLVIAVAADLLTEGAAAIVVSLLNQPDTKVTINVSDSSVAPIPTYELVTTTPQVNEGQALAIVLKTTHIADGTSIEYNIAGISADDLSAGALQGTFVIQAGQASASITIKEDALTEGNETLVVSLPNVPSVPPLFVLVIDTSAAPPPPPPDPFILHSEFLRLNDLDVWDDIHDRYLRNQPHQEADATINPIITVPFSGADLSAGGAYRALRGSKYTLTFWGEPVAEVTLPTPVFKAAFKVDCTNIEPGWKKLGLITDSGESVMTYFMHLRKGPLTPSEKMPIVRGHYDRSQNLNNTTNHWGMVPAKYAPTTLKAMVRSFEPLPDPLLKRAGMHCQQLVPYRWGDVHRPNMSKNGVLSTFDAQLYYWTQLTPKKPSIPLIDGPRGHGTLGMPTHFWMSVADVPGFGDVHLCYFSDPWRVGRISASGVIKTLVGLRHKDSLMHNWQDPQTDMGQLELIGDWSSMPSERQGFHEIWGFGWDFRTFAIDETSPLMDGFHTHVTGPTMYVADSQNDRICKVEFQKDSHEIPPKVTEYVTGIADPWDIVFDNERFYVTERRAHRITERDTATGNVIRVLVQGDLPEVGTFTAKANSDIIKFSISAGVGQVFYLEDVAGSGIGKFVGYIVQSANNTTGEFRLSTWPGSFNPVKPKIDCTGKIYRPLGYVNGLHRPTLTVPLDNARLSPCVLPEGLVRQDDWLYFSSLAQAQVRRVNRVTGELQVVHPVYIDANSFFVKMAISDGTFGARGTTFTWNWSNHYFGGPEIWGPIGPNGEPATPLSTFWGGGQSGGTGDWTVHSGYGTAGCCERGVFINGNMVEGVSQITKAMPGDKVETPAVTAGRTEYAQKGYKLSHGYDGFGFYGLPLPWGESANMDAYLQFVGHVKP